MRKFIWEIWVPAMVDVRWILLKNAKSFYYFFFTLRSASEAIHHWAIDETAGNFQQKGCRRTKTPLDPFQVRRISRRKGVSEERRTLQKRPRTASEQSNSFKRTRRRRRLEFFWRAYEIHNSRFVRSSRVLSISIQFWRKYKRLFINRFRFICF